MPQARPLPQAPHPGRIIELPLLRAKSGPVSHLNVLRISLFPLQSESSEEEEEEEDSEEEVRALKIIFRLALPFTPQNVFPALLSPSPSASVPLISLPPTCCTHIVMGLGDSGGSSAAMLLPVGLLCAAGSTGIVLCATAA